MAVPEGDTPRPAQNLPGLARNLPGLARLPRYDAPAPAEPTADQRDSTGSERQVLEAFLDFHRQVLVSKVDGISEEEARCRRVPSKTTLAGLIKHMIGVERGWFQEVLDGRNPEEIGPKCWRRRR